MSLERFDPEWDIVDDLEQVTGELTDKQKREKRDSERIRARKADEYMEYIKHLANEGFRLISHLDLSGKDECVFEMPQGELATYCGISEEKARRAYWAIRYYKGDKSLETIAENLGVRTGLARMTKRELSSSNS